AYHQNVDGLNYAPYGRNTEEWGLWCAYAPSTHKYEVQPSSAGGLIVILAQQGRSPNNKMRAQMLLRCGITQRFAFESYHATTRLLYNCLGGTGVHRQVGPSRG